MRRPIYLDNHATTPLDPRVVEEMLPSLRGEFGNAGSGSHAYGWEAAARVDTARERLAGLLGAQPAEILFTSGATESNNLAILGAVAHRAARAHVVTLATEHHAVLDTCLALRDHGARVDVLDVDASGRCDVAALSAALGPDTVLVSVMVANNEIGTLQPVSEIAAACRERGVLLHCDAAQAVGRIPVDVGEWGVDLLSLSAHKFHGPKGVGALWVRRGVARHLRPRQHGGGQERGLRPGTLNVTGIVGLGMAAHVAAEALPDEAERVGALRDRLEGLLRDGLEDVTVNGGSQRLPGNLSATFAGVEAEALVRSLPGLAVSAGSACSSGTAEPSHVLRGIGLTDEAARSTLRFGLARFTEPDEVDEAGRLVVAAVNRLRSEAATTQTTS